MAGSSCRGGWRPGEQLGKRGGLGATGAGAPALDPFPACTRELLLLATGRSLRPCSQSVVMCGGGIEA